MEKLKLNCYMKCLDTNCFICKFSFNYYYIKLKNFCLPIQSNSSCDSIGIIYIIYGSKPNCNCFYIGESKRSVLKKITEHIKNINCFKKNFIKSLMNYTIK